MNAIWIVLTFDMSRGLEADLLSRMVEIVEDAVYKSEVEDLRRIETEVRGIPSVALDAARFRIRHFKGSTLHIKRASAGSLILGTAVAGAAYWILHQTLGETITEAWRETPMHHAVKNFFTRDVSAKVRDITKRIKNNIDRNLVIRGKSPQISFEVDQADAHFIRLTIVPRADRQLPPLREDALEMNEDEE